MRSLRNCGPASFARRLLRAMGLLCAAALAACGGGSESSDTAGGGTYLAISISEPPADATLDDAAAAMSGSAACPDCPPSEWAFGYCPAGSPFIPSSAVTVSWANRLTGGSGPAFVGISGSCSCLFSYCVYSYSRKWSASVPLAYGANAIVVTAADAAGGSGTATRTLTRVPPPPGGLAAAPGSGQVTLTWNGMQEATAYNLYWSNARTLTKASGTKIAGATSPYAHTGLADDVTYYYLVAAEVNGLEGTGSPLAWATPGWTATQLVAGTTATTLERDAAIAVDAGGVPHLHFSYDEKIGTASLQYNAYATSAAGGWTVSPVDMTLSVNAGIAVESGGTVHVSYLDFEGLTHAVNVAGTWNSEVVDAAAWCGASFVLDAAGKAHFAYRADGPVAGELRYATNATGSWVTSVAATFSTIGCSTSGRRLAIAVDGAGAVHIAFAGAYPDLGLKYATRQGGAWTVTAVTAPDEGDISQLSAAADAAGRVHVAFADNFGRLRYATNPAGAWSVTEIEAAGSPAYPSLALDAGGQPHASYFLSSYGELRYAKLVAGAWQKSSIADAGGALPNSGSDTAIAVDALGKAHIGYFDNRTGELRYATNRP